jgi:hypothetical protein
MTVRWNIHNALKAQVEGWGVFYRDGDPGHAYIERCDYTTPRFKTDIEAWSHVVEQAVFKNSDLHLRALCVCCVAQLQLIDMRCGERAHQVLKHIRREQIAKTANFIETMLLAA